MLQDSPIDFCETFEFLLYPMRNKGAYGGRGSAKSHQFARASLILGNQTPKRIVCARETQRSIADSVHALLEDCITRVPAWNDFYSIQKTYIRGKNGTEFLFHGLRHDPAAIKSLEGADILWMEEAQSIGKESMEMVIPTIRKPGSEIWASWNPRLETDPIHDRMVIHPAPNTIAKKVSYRDNPWFPEELRIEMEHLRETDYQAYLHVWEGECKSAVEGAVYADELAQAQSQNRIGTVPVDRTQPVHTFWDLGFGDSTAIWFAQALESGQIRIVDYIENHGKPLEWYLIQLQQRGYVYGQHWVPHDATDTIIHSRLAGDRSRSIEQLMRAAGLDVRISPKMHVHTGINAARTVFPSCYFDESSTKEGIFALKNYQWGERKSGSTEPRAPLHDWASHGADAFRCLAVSIEVPQAAKPKPEPRPRRMVEYSPFG